MSHSPHAAHAGLPVPEEPHLALWHAATLLREHRVTVTSPPWRSPACPASRRLSCTTPSARHRHRHC
ncbi:hypothetical protein ACFV6Z_21425 [Streptomyces sp. NPDC059818]|uniref:helix-turn-helix domain-containing protein n=1 Tax=Streptomyces sp. NPDC059818 TaxID=3346962 RepID=UPI00366749C5